MKSFRKTILAAGLSLCALLALAACGGSSVSPGNASSGDAYASGGNAEYWLVTDGNASDGDAEYWVVTDGDASAGNAISDKNARQVRSISFPEKDKLCLTTERSRLYTLSGKGESTLLTDAYVPFYSRWGNTVAAVISGKELWDYDLTTGKGTLLYTSDGGYISQLQRYETGVVFDYYTDFSTAVGIWDERVGERPLTDEDYVGLVAYLERTYGLTAKERVGATRTAGSK